MADHAIMNHRDCEPTDMVLEDSRGLNLSHTVLADRLAQVEYHKIMDEMMAPLGDKAHPSAVLAEMLETGFRGYHHMSQKELMDEWHENEELFYQLYQDLGLYYGLNEDDPLVALEQDENDEVEAYGVPV